MQAIEKTGLNRNDYSQDSRTHSTFYNGSHGLAMSLSFFGISWEDVEKKGLSEIKAIAKRNFRKTVFELHPDSKKCKTHLWARNEKGSTAKKIGFSELIRRYRRIQRLKYMPITYQNCDRVLKIQRDYRTMEDTDFGLNGPA